MAYVAVISLKQTVERLLNSSHIYQIVSSGREIMEFVYKEVESLQQVLKRFDDSSSERVNALDEQIREAVCELEDVIESKVYDQLLSRSEESFGDRSYPFFFSLDLQKDVDSFTQKMKKMKEDYIKELENRPLQEEDDTASSITDSGGETPKLVGVSEKQLNDIKRWLTSNYGLSIVSFFGMAGIGKSTLAKRIVEDPSIMHHFDCRAWVTIGPKPQLAKILQGILVQVNGDDYKTVPTGDKELHENLYRSLTRKKYLIVLDDIWDTKVWDYLQMCFPNDKDQGRVLITTRIQKVAHVGAGRFISYIKEMSFLNDENSWDLLREKVFPDGSCPYQLIEAGKKIAKKCDGLPLMIVTVAGILSKADKTPEYWNKIAEEKQHSIFMDAYNEMSKVTYPSYKYLPQHLKPCFIYMGVFPLSYVVSSSKLVKLWIAEGILDPILSQTIEDSAMKCIEELVSRSVVIAQKSSSRRTKNCRLHSVFWYLCMREAQKKKVFHALNTCADGFIEGIKSERRLSVQNNVLFGIKDVYNSMTSVLTVRSLLCTGPHHQYPVQICSDWKLLRVLDALAIRFYQFPIEVLKLLHLRYLALTYNGKLPTSISQLFNLQYLIVHRHFSIKFSEDLSYLPFEIWEMKELKHLQVTGSNLPDPRGAKLPNLLTLLDVGAYSCTRSIFESIPNLKKLGIQIELAPDAAAAAVPLCCFDHISYLHRLESLKCVIVNPEIQLEVVSPLASLPIFPPSLKKLSLSGSGFPWEYMRNIASLPNLEVLKLRSFAFRGPVWKIEFLFGRLKFLLLEDTDLVHLVIDPCVFHNYPRLIFRHCYKLKSIEPPGEYNCMAVELFDCDPSTSEQIRNNKLFKGYDCVDVHSSWTK